MYCCVLYDYTVRVLEHASTSPVSRAATGPPRYRTLLRRTTSRPCASRAPRRTLEFSFLYLYHLHAPGRHSTALPSRKQDHTRFSIRDLVFGSDVRHSGHDVGVAIVDSTAAPLVFSLRVHVVKQP